MRIILDTDKKTITVPWNYQSKLDEINRIIDEVSGDPNKKKTFTGLPVVLNGVNGAVCNRKA